MDHGKTLFASNIIAVSFLQGSELLQKEKDDFTDIREISMNDIFQLFIVAINNAEQNGFLIRS